MRQPSHGGLPASLHGGRALAGAAVSGIALGVTARIGVHVGTPFGLLLRFGVPWLLVPFAIGATLRAAAKSAAAGAVAMLAAVATYYAVKVLVEHRASSGYGLQMTALWGAIGVVAGAGFGTAGALARTGPSLVRATMAAIASGALAGEAVLMLSQGPNVPAARAACVLELCMAAAVPLVVARRTRFIPVALVLSAAIAVTAVGAISELRSVAFSGGWGAGHQHP
jgi:hypothetical protein